ncbi:MAG TPA: XdhC/CoxI family protein [Chloroflexota bacterium]
MSAKWYDAVAASLRADRPVALATVVRGEGLVGRKLVVFPDGSFEGDVANGALRDRVLADALEALREGRSDTRTYALPDGEVAVFVEAFLPPPTLVVVGAVHTAIALTSMARILGFRVVVVDPRAAFATSERFPHVDQLVVAWPDEALPRLGLDASTYVAVLTHDPKLDEPALRIALASPARYVGAIGSRKTSQERAERLRRQGVTEDQLRRLHAPIGLPLGGRSPEEIALSILSEIVAVRYGRRSAVVEHLAASR